MRYIGSLTVEVVSLGDHLQLYEGVRGRSVGDRREEMVTKL